jgi:TatD family-associated radical SAM protein
MDTYVYRLKQGLYINLTNGCNNDCTFCERQSRPGVGPYRLWLEQEPNADQVMEALEAQLTGEIKEVVFCGYGEPTLRLDTLVEVARRVKNAHPGMAIRINTNGLANLQYGKDITPRLHGLVDTVSISLNAPTAQEYEALCRPAFGTAAFEGLVDFAQKAKAHVPHVVMTVVDVIGPEKVEACRGIAQRAGVDFRVRPMEAL